MSNIKHRDLGRIFCYDVFRRNGEKICEALMTARPVPGEIAHTIDLRLRYIDPNGAEFFYSIDKQKVTASTLDIATKCDRLFEMLIHNDVFWGHVNSFMAEVRPD